MIISASRRTDIPALYSSWFFKRISDGFVFVRNPMNIHMVSKIILLPSVIDCIVFWTKNATPMNNKLHLLKNYNYYFQYTVNNLPKIFEPNIPDFSTVRDTFVFLSKKNGKNRIIWRYDPIILTDEININWHIKNFEYLCNELNIYTNKCVISFADYYKNTRPNMKSFNYHDMDDSQMIEIAHMLKKIADNYGLTIESCAEKINLDSVGIKHGKCIDDKLIEEIIESKINIKKDKNQRDECGCVASVDIGSYNSCINGCRYCYANSNINIALNNFSLHDINSPLLFGAISEKDKIFERECVSCKVLQNELF